MGLERRWLQAVTTAVAICLLSVSQSLASLVRAREGGSAELDCSLTPSFKEATTPNLFPLHVVEWVRLGYNVPVLIKFGVYAPRVHPNYKGRVSLTRGASLLVERLTLEDEGWFECRILLLDSKTDNFQNGTWTFLSITAPPVFIKTPPTFVEVLLGDSLTLSCGAHGNPQPTVVWHKDESPIEKHEKIKVLNGTLSLATVTRNVSGVYKCHVSNTEGNLTHYTQLQVQGPPIIIISPEDTTLNMSQDAVLQCQADAYPSNLTYEWLKQGQNVYHIESLKSRVKILVDGTLLIPNLIPEDAGNYTCIPTNGILTPPSASAHLKVKHPARVGRMLRETYLPAGMEGVIYCPVQADPPVLYVNWTKDGNELNLDNFPGWMVNSEGSVFIATANDNAIGMYTCTPYNSYGTMGQSEPTKVILQDPPSFRVPPLPEYLQEVGRELIIPCEASGDPTPNITWSKIGPSPRSPYVVLSNGSLLLQPLSKDHHGGWECLATNRVATVSAGTVVFALGTSPHAVSSVTVTTEMNQANVSWVPGFDGGFTQKFTVWVKQASRGKHEWASLPVPTSKDYLLVTGLLAGTGYQFSVLPQNKLGSGPFSEIVTVRTKAVPTELPKADSGLPELEPPSMLSANQTSRGVLLQWQPPEAPVSPLTGFVLQARRDQGQWVIIGSNIHPNQSKVLVQGLLRDSVYDLRLMSRSNKVLSEPSESVSVSTTGMEIYPLPPSFLEVIPKPLMAGMIGGGCFLSLAIILSVVTACYMSNRRKRRHRKRRQDLPTALQKNPSEETRSPSRSPDSVLKFKLCPPLPFFPNTTASQSDRSTFDKGSRGEYHDQRKQLLSNSSPPPHYTLFESHLGSQAPSTTALESISRGPDGRFIVQPLPEGSSPSSKNNITRDVLQCNGSIKGSGSNRSSIRDSEKDERKESPLTVDVPELSRPPASPGRVRAMARNFSRHGCFYSDDEQGSEILLERASFYSDNSERKTSDSLRRYRMPGNHEDLFSSLGRRTRLLDRDRPHHGGYQPMESHLTDNSTLVSQLEGELEKDSVNKCAQLAKEREEIERELKNFATNQRHHSRVREDPSPSRKPEHLQRAASKSVEEPVWKPQEVTIRQKYKPSGMTSRVSDYRRACYFGNTSSPLDRLPPSRIQWDISPVTSVTSLIPAQSPCETMSPGPSGDSTEETLTLHSSRSPVTQNTSLPMLSPDVTPDRAKSLSPQKQQETNTKSGLEQNLEENKTDLGDISRSRSPLASQLQGLDIQERPGSSLSVQLHQTERTADGGFTKTDDPSPCSSSISGNKKAGAKSKDRETHGLNDQRASGFYSEVEREGIRTRSRKSEKCLFPDCPSPISTLSLVEEVESDQSQFLVPQMSGSFKAKPTAPSSKMSPHQTSAILEYLSLPGFIEMSVDEPVEEVQGSNTNEQASEQKPVEKPVVAKPDVVPRNWEVHVQEKKETVSSQKKTYSLDAADSSFDASKKQGTRRSPHVETRVRFPDDPRPSSSGPEKTSRELYNEKTRIRAGTPESRPGTRSVHTLFNAAKSMADIVSKHSQSCDDRHEFSSEQPQRQASQGSRTNKIVSRITQAPVPFLKKSLSLGPCRTLSGVAQPRPYLKKSISLGSQRWEHFETPRTYISEKCYWDEFPNPDVRVKSYSLGRTPPSLPTPGPCWREYIPFRRPSMGSLERPHHTERSLASPSYLTAMYPPRQTSMSPMLEPSDLRHQAAIFPESSRCSPSYQDTLGSVQHHYVPVATNLPYYQHWPEPRRESMRYLEPRFGPPRSYLPRGISWPSPHYPAFPPREGESYRYPDRMMGRGGDTEFRDGGRASYASQSSGRGSAGLFRQSLSITPTLLSSPETTEEHQRHRAEMEMAKRRVKRRNTSVDESYEWDAADACLDSEVLEATKFDQSQAGFQQSRRELGSDQTGGLRDQQQKGPPPPVNPPRSLSEARFTALRLELQEYKRAQGSACALEPRSHPDHDSDSDSSSALL
ncbi:protein turtle homolog A isoform X1 [Cyprinodon tularosa]|uniref:protein turtle homolog A isoform X1 n=1 Tax=Cyprinodon tularosa TaxID=77115 RepID=UPI0018E1F253|nr:protein turtle homolog A isoform X1 [Cyprinodon tularosa]